jgi:predicted Zn-dependent peptidase
MLNRTLTPALLHPEKINIPEPVIHILPGGVPLYIINLGTEPVMKIELLFAAGKIAETRPLVAMACSELIDEGSLFRSSAEIAESLDNYGAYLQTECGNDIASVTLYTLSRFLTETLPVFGEILMAPAYPEHELATFCTQGKQRLSVSLEKVDVLARRNFLNSLYGDQHPYGKLTSVADYDNITVDELRSFHESNYKNGLMGVLVSGKFSDTEIDRVKAMLTSLGFSKGNLPSLPTPVTGPEKRKIKKQDAVQSAIRIGRKMFNRCDPDYFGFSILNTVLGGYFGSRLMTNIREDKGYTYGIGSGMIAQINDGYFFITTEVGSDVCDAAVKEIYHEINRLIQEPIPADELDLVKNYLFGTFQRNIDGPFALSDRYQSLLLNNLQTDHYYSYLKTLESINPKQLQTLARQYLAASDLFEIVVGN